MSIENQNQPNHNQVQNNSSNSSKIAGVMALVLLFVCVIGGVLVYSFLQKGSQQDNSQNPTANTNSQKTNPTKTITIPPNTSNIAPVNFDISKNNLQASSQAQATDTKETKETKETDGKIFSKTDLLDHSTQESCYIAYKNQVYDITTFLPNHPGGARKPMKECGKIVDSFSQIHEGGSFDSPEIQDMLKTKIIGSLAI